jgi:hypothetical protein
LGRKAHLGIRVPSVRRDQWSRVSIGEGVWGPV